MIRYAIPSYKRAETLNSKTLKYLIDDCGINPSIIDVFVANENERNVYKKSINRNISIIIGAETLKGQRNFMDFYYSKGQCVMFFDDDIEAIYKKNGNKSEPFFDIDMLAKIGFNECKKENTCLFGICAVNNGFYMSNKITTNLKYIVGCCYGQIITRNKRLLVSLEDKEDFERTILYFDEFKKVVRLNMFAPKTNYYTEPGGMQITRTPERTKKSGLYLAHKYPQYCSVNTNKKSKHFEIKLKNKAK